MRVDLLASERHFLDHLAPIWHALPAERRGEVHVYDQLLEHAKSLGLVGKGHRSTGGAAQLLRGRRGVVMTASYRDLKTARDAGRQVVYAEHGAGQSYSDNQTSYAGGANRLGVCLLLVPGEHPAERNRRTHPAIRQEVVGSPKMDAWHLREPKVRGDKPVVAVSFHWDCQLFPEARSAWDHYRKAIPQLAVDERWKLLGHGHPRILEQLRRVYEANGVEVVPDFHQVLERADVYCVDNSSTLFEFASTDRPVVVMNCPLYRRNVEHGLRFWECADVGVQVDQADQLVAGIARALEDAPEQQHARRRAVARVYRFTDGRASERAASAIVEVLEAMPEQVDNGGRPTDSPRMQVTKTYSGHEGYVHPGAEVYPGYRQERQGWRRLRHVGIPQQRTFLINRGNARDWPEEAPLAGPSENKIVGPSEHK